MSPASQAKGRRAAAASKGTVGELIDYLSPQVTADSLLAWPPDAFALAATLLQESGAYVDVVDYKKWPPPAGRPRMEWTTWILEVGGAWRRYVSMVESQRAQDPQSPGLQAIRAWVTRMLGRRRRTLAQFRNDRDTVSAVLQIMAAADEVFRGVGFHLGDIGQKHEATAPDIHDKYLGYVQYLGYSQLLDTSSSGICPTLCRRVHPSKAIVLPKSHTPDKGVTLRSLSHNLALLRAGEITPIWNLCPPVGGEGESDPGSERAALTQPPLNLLILPWPREVRVTDFAESAHAHLHGKAEGNFGFFGYAPGGRAAGAELRRRRRRRLADLERVFSAAESTVGRVDAVVFPELALEGEAEVAEFSAFFLSRVSHGFFVAGFGVPPKPPRRPGQNKACVVYKITPDLARLHDQGKHHRWQLEESQIRTYHLGARLRSQTRWWEDIELQDRQLYFFAFSPFRTASVLICEDLARQEPAAEVLRAVGPNLVIALLMDGPQLIGRWSSRYATALADDPGCSVLCVTSLGMALLSRPDGRPPNRTVALWKDAQTGAREITLPEGAEGVVISLSNRIVTEWTADGRRDVTANMLSFSGEYPIFTDR